jgi:hypothetical protein
MKYRCALIYKNLKVYRPTLHFKPDDSYFYTRVSTEIVGPCIPRSSFILFPRDSLPFFSNIIMV